jgi:hypothetical protein
MDLLELSQQYTNSNEHVKKKLKLHHSEIELEEIDDEYLLIKTCRLQKPIRLLKN